jgi:hypothetical protein
MRAATATERCALKGDLTKKGTFSEIRGRTECSPVLERGRSKISWTMCRFPVRPFDYIVKAGQAALPKPVTGEWRNHDAIFGCYSPP